MFHRFQTFRRVIAGIADEGRDAVRFQFLGGEGGEEFVELVGGGLVVGAGFGGAGAISAFARGRDGLAGVGGADELAAGDGVGFGVGEFIGEGLGEGAVLPRGVLGVEDFFGEGLGLSSTTIPMPAV